ncbi:protein SODIUM POTASSIUM ROOT DEFECTIVE 2-like [Aristolochia californica]|uniref:protein SODIUM POTASSIUM ROOT DEFECTIVE 2-like n=1 Tax=Aristolochia californica TaxID=171875 RepID=UPI0035DEBC9D
MKRMKGIDLFCASPASTAICVSMDQKSMVMNSSRVLDRHTPLIIDSRRSSRPPSLLASGAGASSSSSSSQPNSKPKPHRAKSRKSSAKQKSLTSPPGSSRYLLREDSYFDVFPDFGPLSALVPVQQEVVLSRPIKNKAEASEVFKPSSPTRHEQVVVLRVSLHCKGCEMKVKKHISRMQGVKSFDIDFQAKKVTVIGDVTPLGVLTSISRVKNAQFWPSPSPPPPPPTQPSSSSPTLQLPLSVYR